MVKVGIVGGGVGGLGAAYELAKLGHQVFLYERAPFLGGLAAPFPVGEGRLERFYHHLFLSDTTIIDLLGELDLLDHLIWEDSKVGMFIKDKIYNFSGPIDLLKFKPVSFINRIRMGLVALYLQKTKNWEKLESKTASEFMLKWAGKRNYEVIWGPLLEGKFTIYKDQVAMPWLWSKFATRVASRDKGLKEKLGYISGSWGVLIDELEQRILEMGGEVHVSTSVERILVQDNKVFGLTIQEKGTKSRDLSLDMVIATVPSFTLPNLVELPEEYVSKLRGVNYEGAIAVIFVLKHRLSNIYWLNVMDPTIPFLLVLEQTNLVPPEQYGGKHIIYTANYVTADDYRWNMDARDIVNEYLPYLKRINPEFDESWIEDYYVHKEPAAQPIVTVNYRNKMPDVKTPVEGLWLASMSQVYPQDRGTNYSLKLAVEVARKAIETVE